MQNFLIQVESIVNAAISWIGSFVTLTTSTPMLLFFMAFPVVGYGIKLLKRLIHL